MCEMQMYDCKDCSKVCTDAEAEADMMGFFTSNTILPEYEFHSVYDIAKHLRKKHGVDIHTTTYDVDAHGHSWYCFSCNSKSGKNHRSFDSDQALFDHLRDVHGILMRIAGSASAPP